MDYLQTIMNTPGETTDIMEPNGTFQQQVSTQNGGADQNFPPSAFNASIGFLHNHGKGPGILSVFSQNDLASFYTIITSGNVANPLTYTFGLVNQDGQSYLLAISDINQFNTWASTYTTNGQPNDFLNSIYNNLISSTNTDLTNEDNFATLLQSTKSGLTLMKGNSTNTSWSTVVKNADDSFSIVPCPTN